MGLQRIVVSGHQGGHGAAAVMAGPTGQGPARAITKPQPIALPIEHPPATPSGRIRGLEEQIDRAGEEATAGNRQQGYLIGVIGTNGAAGVVGKGGGEGLSPHRTQGEIEIHLVEPLARRQICQSQAPKWPAKGGESHLLQPHQQGLDRLGCQPCPAQFRPHLLPHRFQLPRDAVVQALQNAVQAIAGGGPPGKVGQRAVGRPLGARERTRGWDRRTLWEVFKFGAGIQGVAALVKGLGGHPRGHHGTARLGRSVGPGGVAGAPPAAIERAQRHGTEGEGGRPKALRSTDLIWGRGRIDQAGGQGPLGQLLLQPPPPFGGGNPLKGVVVGASQGLFGEQPGHQGTGSLLGHRSPGQQQQVFGPGHGDIGQALSFGLLGGTLLAVGGIADAPAPIQVQIEVGLGRVRGQPAAAQGRAAAAAGAGGLPEIGADHHWELQALTAVDRDDSHGAVDAVAVCLMVVRQGAIFAVAQPPQPIGQGGGTQALGVALAFD